ncbi:MAG: hypothetical protein WBD56_17840, partial [Anaerolineales bacterium]
MTKKRKSDGIQPAHYANCQRNAVYLVYNLYDKINPETKSGGLIMHEKSIELLNKAVAEELSATHQY